MAFTIGTPDSEDVSYARRVTRDLGVDHEVIELTPGEIRLPDIREAIRMSEPTEYGDVINAVISRLLFARVRSSGVKVVLCGDGSDELFGGYEMYRQPNPALRQRIFQHKLHNLGRTELQRVDRTSMGQGVEARVPFLDLALVRLAMRLAGDQGPATGAVPPSVTRTSLSRPVAKDSFGITFIAMGLLTAPWLLRRYGALARSLLAPTPRT